jgi:hypothetical protein
MEGYLEAAWKMDKFMYEEADMDEYYQILKGEDMTEEEQLDALCEFIDMNLVDEERMYSYFPDDGNITDFAKYLIEKYKEQD